MKTAPRNVGSRFTKENARLAAIVADTVWYAGSNTIRLSIGAIAIAFAPCFILAAIHGSASLQSFLIDYAAQTRLWIVIPLLIAAEPALVAQHNLIAQHILKEKLAIGKDRMRIKRARVRLLRLGKSPLAAAVLVFLVYLPVSSLFSEVKSGVYRFQPWMYGSGNFGSSHAGTWYLLVSLPLVGFLLLRWCWRQLLWAWFLRKTAQSALRLIPSHPDGKAGLKFVEICLLAYFPFGFALGMLFAGGVANRIVYFHSPLSGFKYVPLAMLAIVLIFCVSPLGVFTPTLLNAKRQGIFHYGALATALGRKFEEKWLAAETHVEADALDANDFSAATDLYSIADNVHRIVPFLADIHLVGALCAFTLLPAIPVLFAALPFDVILERIFKLLL